MIVAIISLLSSVVLASLSGARESSRDARRQQDMRQIRTAIEMYRNRFRHMPGLGGSCVTNKAARFTTQSSCIHNEFKKVMQSVPEDPIADEDYFYAYDPNHYDSENLCPDQSNVVIGFNKSETGIKDQQTTCGSDGNIDDADFNRMICGQ